MFSRWHYHLSTELLDQKPWSSQTQPCPSSPTSNQSSKPINSKYIYNSIYILNPSTSLYYHYTLFSSNTLYFCCSLLIHIHLRSHCSPTGQPKKDGFHSHFSQLVVPKGNMTISFICLKSSQGSLWP